MDEETMLRLLKADLQRQGSIPGDEEYLAQLLRAAKANLTRQGLREDQSADYYQLVVSTAAWLYRKRANGEPEPLFLRRMRLDMLMSQAGVT
jgi:hypothetical protein